ncbi:VCBS repeat-containing protein [Pontixanthobacter gangjinensis]|uniref:ASPIC/UnbV domain-containing protein n=1 Tax=Christiangramia aestuarii TaxID=1028746 RepID=A0A7K1LP14_9FLAO|nr:VCBS repeat-containing protein [Christiangramia aestuarii]MUP42552.1 hypothetical protein [Christiangramia aestuarii]
MKTIQLRKLFILVFGFFLVLSCSRDEGITSGLRFRVLEPELTGIDFSNRISSSKELNILNYLYFYNGAGVAAADFNNDGYTDLYFCSNQETDHLYLNEGGFKFQDVSRRAGIAESKGWSTGVTTVDINNDGLLDIYVCEVGNYKSLQGHNRLYVNQGISENGIPVFKEESAKYNLNFKGLSTQASFFDYDLDGDLDMFLMNHSVHPNSNYGSGVLRKKPDTLSGDRLFKNDNGRFMDVSEESGIYSSKIGYGLGLATGDLNNDGYPDIYIGNDFFENDYLYINQAEGSFRELISRENSGIAHTSHYSMGVDIADFNNDGLQDILSLDMLPEDLTTYKASGTDFSYHIYHNYLQKGYANQYMQNALQLNQGDLNFSEIAYLSGVAATEWSWAPLFADLDNDGYKDIFISNGILGATNDMDYISFIANENIQKRLNKGITDQDMKIIEEIPEKKTENYFFKNSGGLKFQKMNDEWLDSNPSFSNGAVYADLDNDGDLDLVTNNVNEEAFVYENTSWQLDSLNYLKIGFEGPPNNRFGIGSKVEVYNKAGRQVLENFTTRGFLSSVVPELHFGLGKVREIDSVKIIWPGGKFQTIRKLKSNQRILVDFENSTRAVTKIQDNALKQNYTPDLAENHREYSFRDFIYEPLIPYSQSNLGPAISVLDFNADGNEDIYFSGDKFNMGKLLQQAGNGEFKVLEQSEISTEGREPTDQVFFDADKDGDMDLLVVYGGSDLNEKNKNYPSLYVNKGGRFYRNDSFPKISINASLVRNADFNGDGYEDIFIASNSDFGTYGETNQSVIFLNDRNGNFKPDVSYNSALEDLGMIYDAEIVDINKDGKPDIVLAGHYMPISFLLNDGQGNLDRKSIANSEGWWNELELADMDKDGDLDIVAGNWGLNSRLQASVESPMQLYLQDFDDNGKVDPILTYYYQSRETPLATKEELTKQIPKLNKDYLSYTEFAKADFNDYFSEDKISSARKKKVVKLETSYFENKGNLDFKVSSLPIEVQFSPVHAILLSDFDGDDLPDILLGGNNYHVNTQLGRQDAGLVQVLRNLGNGNFKIMPRDFYVRGAIKSIKEVKIKDSNFLIFGINNDSIRIVKYPNSND